MVDIQEGLLLIIGQVIIITVLLGLGLWLIKSVVTRIAEHHDDLQPKDDEPSALDAWSKDVF